VLCESLGAEGVFDYSDHGVEDAVVQALRGRRVVGALDCIGDGKGSLLPCARIFARVLAQRQEEEEGQGRENGSVGMISTVLAPPPDVVLPRGVTATRRKCFLFILDYNICFPCIFELILGPCSTHSRPAS